jgi:hypothetical protein
MPIDVAECPLVEPPKSVDQTCAPPPGVGVGVGVGVGGGGAATVSKYPNTSKISWTAPDA